MRSSAARFGRGIGEDDALTDKRELIALVSEAWTRSWWRDLTLAG